MTIRLYTPVYATTLLLSAALLFSVQPMFSKMVLPLLGGTPQVWNTAMLFFQATLLAGYAYAHGTSRFLNIRMQAVLHLILLTIFVAVLPFGIPEGSIPPADSDPTLWQLSLMALVIGGPFFVLSGSAPMFQRWFAGTKHPDADNPYFLYGASNLGSMTSLLAYPFLIEPFFTLDTQSSIWMVGYITLIIFTLAAAFLVWTSQEREQDKSLKKQNKEEGRGSIAWKLRGKWLLLSFLPSSLMLGVTTYITTDIASVPLLWILPLALYVGTFIIVFSRKEYVSKNTILLIQGGLFALLITKTLAYTSLDPFLFIGLHFLLFFFCALACHKELADSKPAASHLTEFYLIMSLGGALGGVFNALIAPRIFLIPLEYTLVLVVIAFLRYGHRPEKSFHAFIQKFTEFRPSNAVDKITSPAFIVTALIAITAVISLEISDFTNIMAAAILLIGLASILNTRWALGLCLCFTLLAQPPGYKWQNSFMQDLKHLDRNFFGVMRVMDTQSGERILLHGTTNHGAQPLAEDYRLERLSYYGQSSPLTDVFKYLDNQSGEQSIGVLGLGIGVTACYQKEGRSYDFFEIDPDIARIAQNPELFTYLSDCGSPYEIILGDGRLTIENKPDGIYDLIFLDVFSSDNIPVHVMTLEAIQTYLSKLKPDGIFVMNISNNFIDIEPVVTAIAEKLGRPHLAKMTDGQKIEGTDLSSYLSHYFLFLPDNDEIISHFKELGWSPGMRREGVKLWSDQYSNIVSALGNDTAFKRYQASIANIDDESTESLEGEQ
ncbi:MAG: spermidine synthase [Alphaproteobacteria bacterium]